MALSPENGKKEYSSCDLLRLVWILRRRLLFVPADKVDMVWSSIACSSCFLDICSNLTVKPASLVSGPLCSTSAHIAKVSTSSVQETANLRHLICVYIPDVYDKASVTEVPLFFALYIGIVWVIFQQVMRVLLRNHGANLSGVKSDLYTTIGQFLILSEGLYTVFIIFYLQEFTEIIQVEFLLQYV